MELLNLVCVHFNTEKPELKCPGQQSWNDGLVGEILYPLYPSLDPQNAYNQGVGHTSVTPAPGLESSGVERAEGQQTGWSIVYIL